MERLREVHKIHLSSIALRGIMPQTELEELNVPYISSVDHIPNRFVHCRDIINQPDKKILLGEVRSVVHVGYNSIHHILCERPGVSIEKVYDEKPEILQDRIIHSLVIIANNGNTIRQFVPTNEFVAILTPTQLFEDVSNIFQAIPVYEMDKVQIPLAGKNRSASITIPDYEQGLMRFLQKQKVGDKFLIHAVRLPSEFDIPFHQDSKLTTFLDFN